MTQDMTHEKNRKYEGLQNLGWVDRVIRFMIGAALVGAAAAYLVLEVAPAAVTDGTGAGWPYYAILISLYVFITAATGFEPIYKPFNFRTCGDSPRNPCGSFPYEVEAAMGEKLKPKDEVDHSLENTPGRGL